ncbi:MAG TPA: hypothetical protein VMG82_31400 [Candidatus Sulfotelmatobacter sp.]|nr:hypothetical protein [Candidatus Sulfotelmatobacter sp.]
MTGEYQIAELVRKLNRLEVRIKMELGHVRMLRGIRPNIEARTLVETANDLGRVAIELEEYLLQLVGEAQSATRRFPVPRSLRARSLAQQQALNPGFASAVGYRNELRALACRLPEQMHALIREVQTLSGEATMRLNDPGRYGDAAAAMPINDLFSVIFGVLDAIGRWVEKKKQAALPRGA